MFKKVEIIEIEDDEPSTPTPNSAAGTSTSQQQQITTQVKMAIKPEIVEIEDDVAPTTTRNTATSTSTASAVNNPNAVNTSKTVNSSGAANNSNAPAVPASSAARPASPRPATAALPNTPRSLFDLPEFAERYQPIFSTLEDVVYRDPHKFCLKPPYWERWSTEDYREFAHQLQLVDLRPIARKLNKPVEEVLYMYDGLVVGPLQDARKASDRGVQTMRSWFKLYQESGTPTRSWTDYEVKGELENITCRTVHLILETGNKGKVKLEDLNKEDYAWIHKNITLENRRVLSGLADGKDVKFDTEDGLPPYIPVQSSKRKASPELATPQPQKKRRLSAEPATAPAKMLATPSVPMSVSAASTPVQQDATPSKAPVHAPTPRTKSEARSQTQTAAGKDATQTAGHGPKASPASLRIYRQWTSGGIMARLMAMVPSAIVLQEQESKAKVRISRCALSKQDKEWLNVARRDRLIDDDAWAALKSTSTSADAFRLWTARNILAHAESLSRQAVRLLLLSDKSVVEVSPDDLLDEDKEYLQQHFTAKEIDTLYEEVAEEAGSDDGAGDDTEAPIGDGEAQGRQTGGHAEVTAATPQPVQNSVDDLRSNATPPAFEEEPEEVIAGAPVRNWSDASFLATLVGISEKVVFLRVKGEQEMRKLPMAKWSIEDKNWVKEYLDSEQRDIILGKGRK